MNEAGAPGAGMQGYRARSASPREAIIAPDVQDAEAHWMAAQLSQKRRDHARAVHHCSCLIAVRPHSAEALRLRAQLRATSRDPAVRDPAGALRDARAALELARESDGLHSDWVHRSYLGTLAAALEANGRFEDAIEVLRAGLPYANTRTSRAALDDRIVRLAVRRFAPDAVTRRMG